MSAITRTRLQTYPAHEHPLLPGPAVGDDQAWTQADWEKLVCEVALARTGADAVWLRELPPMTRLPGPLTELQVADQLAILDVLEVHRVPGTKFGSLLLQVQGVVPVTCGAQVGSLRPKVQGRSIDGERTYLVATTDRSRLGSPIDSLLKGVRSSRWLDQPPMRVVLDSNDKPLTLRRAVLEGFRELSMADSQGFAPELLARSHKDKHDQWLVKVRQISLHAESFRGTDNERFLEVPETLATSPSSLTIGASADIALDYSTRSVLWDLRWRSAYTRLSTLDDRGQETADDWRISTSAALPRFAFPAESPLRFMPYGELAFDSEFTPTLAEDGTSNDFETFVSTGIVACWPPVPVARFLK
jgi:hypothetical protein